MKINLRKLRIKRGLTIPQLSRKSHVGAGTISRIENHEIYPTIPTICKLCIALNVPINEMIECERYYYDDDEW
jgi:transcriptional regulator with XRE-family HTH domain